MSASLHSMWSRTADTPISVWVGRALVLIGFGVLTQNVLLMRQNQALRIIRKEPLVQPGTRIGTLMGLDLEGRLRNFVFSSKAKKRYLVVTISPNCPTCKANQPQWKELTRKLRDEGSWGVLWVSRGGVAATRTYSTAHALPPQEVIADPLYRTYRGLGLDLVPQMFVVDAAGVVTKSWVGRQPWTDSEVMAPAAYDASGHVP